MARRTIAELMSDAASTCRVRAPSVWHSTTDVTALSLVKHLKATVRDLLDRVDWSSLNSTGTLTGDGVADTFDLPADCYRLTRDEGAVLEIRPTRRIVNPVTTNAQWTSMVANQASRAARWYRNTGDNALQFYRLPEAGASIKLSYISDSWIQPTGGGATIGTWSAATDRPLLPEDLLELGVVFRHRKDKGLAYVDDKTSYEMKLARFANDTQALGVVDMGGGGGSTSMLTKTVIPDILPS